MSRVGVVTICDGRIVSRQCCACSQHAHGAAMKPMSLGDIFRPLGHVRARDASCDTLISARHPRLSSLSQSRQSGRARKAPVHGISQVQSASGQGRA